MFGHVFKNSLKVTLSDRMTVFWTIAFPIILGFLFSAAFSGINDAIKFKVVPVAVITNSAYDADTALKQTLAPLTTGDSAIFKVTSVATKDEAAKLLENKTVDGSIESNGDTPIVTVRGESGSINETIVKLAVDSSLQQTSAIKAAVANDPALANSGGLAVMSKNYQTDTTTGGADRTVLYYYSLIGMACMYAGFLGIIAVNRNEANQTKLGARLSVSPARRATALLAGLSAGYVVALIAQLALFGFLALVLGVSFGNASWAILLAMLVGSLTGLTVGTFIGAVSRKSEAVKIDIQVAISMLFSVLAGMMGTTFLKHSIDQNLPLLAAINPVNNVSDALFAVYYYGVGAEYWRDLLYLALIAVAAVAASWYVLRRKSYASL